jgi:rare lipoprotein A
LQMRLPVNRAFALTIVTLLAACGHGQGDSTPLVSAPLQSRGIGPAADYPVVLGAPYTVDGVTYTPEDKLNFDSVGYAAVGAGEGVTVAHRTLPLPSYAEVTSLQSGKTILVRVTRRGPMSGSQVVELSPDAAVQLGVTGDHSPIRIRRVNPPEQERAALRSGGQAPSRMDTPIGLVNVLRRKLDPSLSPLIAPGAAPLPGVAQSPVPAIVVAPPASPKPVVKAPVIAAPKAPAPKAAPVSKPAPAVKPEAGIYVQVGAFSTRERGAVAAKKAGGSVSPAGKLFRVRVGPFSSRGEAEAALAKAKAAGYSDARIQRAD